MGLNSGAVFDAAVSHAMSLGVFDRVSKHEPKSKPGSGLTLALWAQRVTPVAAHSGLAVTSARLVLNERIYTNMLADPQDEIDPRVTSATDLLMNAYLGDFTLGDLVSYVDVFGRHGVLLDAQAGYVNQDGALLRVMTITLPLIISDVWIQVA